MALNNSSQKPSVLIVLVSLAAEGCPQLALSLAAHWQRQCSAVSLLCLESGPSDMMAEFEALGIPIHTCSLGNGWLRYLRLVWASYHLCACIRPHAVLSFPLGWHSFLAIGARLARVRYVCAHVGNLPPIWTGIAFVKFKAMVQLGRPFTNRLLCCSEYIRKATQRDFGLTRRETSTIYNACDLSRFLQSNFQLVPHHPPRLGMVARLELHKDQPTLLRAMALLRDQQVDAELWLIGEGSLRPQLEGLIADLGIADRVHLLGSRRDIPYLLSQLDIFVFPALPDEGFGIALAEAMATGLPIVATKVGACLEVLDGGRCGLLVEPGSAEALAKGICQVLADPAASHERAQAARKRAMNEFSVPTMAHAYGLELGLS